MIRLSPLFAALLATTALPAFAAPAPTLDQRVDRVERQLKAVQRKVFPGGDAAFQQPEIAAPEVQATTGMPAGNPLNEITARVDALERSVAQLTGQVEQEQHRLDLLSQQSAQDRQEFTLRLKALETAAAPPAAATPAPAPEDDAAAAPPPRAATTAKPKPGATPADKTAAPTAPKPGAAKPTKPVAAAADDAADTASTAAPAAGADPAEDAYMAGYKLWTQKKYPQAEAALAAVAKKYPKHRRASYAQNLLGRAYLDDGQPARAAEAFAANYTSNPRGERAPDSLYFLGQSLVALKKPTDACRVYDELNSAYGDKIDAALKAKVATARTDAKCK